MGNKCGFIFVFYFSILICHSQSPNDISGSTSICGDIDFTYTPTGPGVDDFSSNTNPTCLPSDPVESQSIWLTLTFDTGGTLEFTLVSNNGTDDYDWALFDITTAPVNTTGTQLRCSSTMWLAPNGATGMGNGATDITEGPGTGDGFLAPVNVNPGDVLLLFVNNWSSSTSGFDLSFGGTATFNPPPVDETPVGVVLDLEECDVDGVSDNSTFFDLVVNTPIMTGVQTGVTITYHLSNGDAQIGSDAILDPAAYRNISDPQTIYARITNVGTECFSVADFEIDVLDSLSIVAPDIDECDDNNDGLWNFDFTQSDADIIGGQTGSVVSYYENETDAINSFPSIVGLYQNTSNPQIIWTRLDDPASGCFGVDSFEIEVYNVPTASIAPIMSSCDDDNNGSMPFVLTDQDAFINTDAGVSITYHSTQDDADDGSNPISSPFESGTAIIYARVENDLNTTCYDTTAFDIEVYDAAFPLDAASVSPIQECDNSSFGTDADGIIEFDLTQNETDILNGQSDSEFSLTYFTDAGYLNLIGIPAAFTNTIANGQTIYVRMTNNLEGSCYSDTSFEIEVFDLPVLNTPPFVLEQCDDDFDGYNVFNLTEINTDIVTNIITEVFTYYESPTDANLGSDPISNPTTYTNIDPSTDDNVWVRIENDHGCFRTTQIELVVKPSAIPTSFLEEFYACDDGTDTNDGVATFDFSSVTTQIETIFPVNITVHYYENEADATSELNEIPDPSNYQNTNSPGMQEIWVRADSALGNDCLGNGHHVTLHVNPLPQFDVDPTRIVCLNLPAITLETYNALDTYSYVWADQSNTVVSNNPTAQVTAGGVYTVVASFTYPDGTVCQSEPRSTAVSESSIADIRLEDITVVDDTDNNTITIDTTNENLGIGDYEYALDNSMGGVGFYQDEPFFEMVAPGIRTVFVQDKNNCGVAEIEVAVVGFPKFFTPNNDGQNDTWQIQGVGDGFFTTSTIIIYDRYGKLVTQIDPTSTGWDGYYNGNPMPSTDYWFTAQLIDQDGNIRNRKGSFSLVRR